MIDVIYAVGLNSGNGTLPIELTHGGRYGKNLIVSV